VSEYAVTDGLNAQHGYGTERLAYKPQNTSYVVLGTVFLWFGWFGFNGGSALSANLRAAYACVVTNLAASVGGLTWLLWVRLTPGLSLAACYHCTIHTLIRELAGLATGTQVVCGWLLLRSHCWSCGHHPCIGLRRCP